MVESGNILPHFFNLKTLHASTIGRNLSLLVQYERCCLLESGNILPHFFNLRTIRVSTIDHKLSLQCERSCLKGMPHLGSTCLHSLFNWGPWIDARKNNELRRNFARSISVLRLNNDLTHEWHTLNIYKWPLSTNINICRYSFRTTHTYIDVSKVVEVLEVRVV